MPNTAFRRRTAQAATSFVVGLLVLPVSLAFADPAPALDPGNTIRIALIGDMRSSMPGVQRDSNSDDVLQHVVEPLVAHRGDLSIGPMVADSYEVSGDLRSYRFTLREGLLFHNYEPVLAQHLVFNWNKILDPATGFQCLPFFNGTIGAKVVSVVAEDERTLRIELDKPNALFLEMLASVQCGVAVLHPDSWDGDGRWRAPIATGPFRLSEWRKGRFVTLERFDGYRPRREMPSGLAGRKFACVDYLRWMSITDPLAANAAVVSGQTDLSYSVAPVAAREMERNGNVLVTEEPGAGRQVILIRRADPLLGDVRMRKAIAHALDVRLFAAAATLGMAGPNPSVVPARSFAHSAIHDVWVEHDVSEAARLLEEIGYDGRPLVLKTTRATQLLFDTAVIAQAMLKEAGLNVTLEVMEWSALIAAYFEGDYQLMTFEYSPRLTPFMSYLAVIGIDGRSKHLWNDPAAAALLRQATEEADIERRFRLFDGIHRRMLDEIPFINLYNLPIIDVTSRRIRGYRTWIGGTPRLWNVCLEDSSG